jgi:hypothetical protein
MMSEPLRFATPEEKQNAPYRVNGFIPSPQSSKHWLYGQKIDMAAAGDLPRATMNVKPGMIFDQGQEGSCTGNGGSYHKGFQERPSHNGLWLVFSRSFLYKLARTLDGIAHNGDDGSTPLAIMQVLQKFGVCLESTLPYQSNPNDPATLDAKNIPQQAYTEALNYRIKNYAKCLTVDEMKHALAAGKTLLSGLIVTDSFMHPDNGGFCGLPLGTIYGGHCINIVDYDDDLEHTYADGHTEKGFFLFPNSWSDKWGDQGYGKIPYSFITFMNKDFGTPFFMEAWTSIDLDSDPVPPPVRNNTIEIWEGNTTAKVNGNDVTLDQPPIEQNGRILVPIRFISQALGAQVDWDQNEKKVTVTN